MGDGVALISVGRRDADRASPRISLLQLGRDRPADSSTRRTATRGRPRSFPLQVLTDFLPRRLPDLYDFDGAQRPASRRLPDAPRSDAEAAADDPRSRRACTWGADTRTMASRVVVIDAGHGGGDPGALGVGGVREKDVALGIALRLAEIPGRPSPTLEVHLTRDDDSFVDLWDRGEIATNIKGERPGIFVSIHGNSFPGSARHARLRDVLPLRGAHRARATESRRSRTRRYGWAVRRSIRRREPDLGFILRELREPGPPTLVGHARRVRAGRAARRASGSRTAGSNRESWPC